MQPWQSQGVRLAASMRCGTAWESRRRKTRMKPPVRDAMAGLPTRHPLLLFLHIHARTYLRQNIWTPTDAWIHAHMHTGAWRHTCMGKQCDPASCGSLPVCLDAYLVQIVSGLCHPR